VRRRALGIAGILLVLVALSIGLGYWSHWANTPEQQQKRLANLRADNMAARQDTIALRLYGRFFDELSPSQRERVKIRAAAEDLSERLRHLE